jgi:hypothetical protein
MEAAGMAAALGLEATAHRMLETHSRVERAWMAALAVKAREARRVLDLEQAIRMQGGDVDG